jgi:hypothetical protein
MVDRCPGMAHQYVYLPAAAKFRTMPVVDSGGSG